MTLVGTFYTHPEAPCHPEQRERICMKRRLLLLAQRMRTLQRRVLHRSFRVAQDDGLLMFAWVADLNK